jgi:hypothetical protein
MRRRAQVRALSRFRFVSGGCFADSRSGQARPDALCSGHGVLRGSLFNFHGHGKLCITPPWYPEQNWLSWAAGASFLGGGLALLFLFVIGAQHFMHAHFVAGLIPDWIPGHLFWAYFVGMAFFASAIAIMFRVSAVPASALLGLIFLLWVLFLHLPSTLSRRFRKRGCDAVDQCKSSVMV